MIMKQGKVMEIIGQAIGFLSTILLLSTILYFLLKALNKLPLQWSYLHITCVVFLIAFASEGLKRLLQ